MRACRALGAALVELMLAHEFEDVTVQQVLKRARVGRATFYTHFRNKHDLLLSDAARYFEWLERQFLETAGASRRLAPVEELWWWLTHRTDADARETDARFHSIAWAGVARTV